MQLVQINQKPTMPTIADMIRQMAQQEAEEIRRARERVIGQRK
jgi:DNA-binding protein